MSVLPHDTRILIKHFWKTVLAVFLVVAILSGWLVYEKLFRVVPQPYVAGTPASFKYGSIGVEDEAGIPYWIWLVLPRVFPEYLPGPGGYTSLGIVWEPGHEMPVGFSKKHIGYDRVGINCAVCHTATFRTLRKDNRPTRTQIVPTGPAIRFDAQGYLAFLGRCAADPRFNPDTILEAIEYNIKLSVTDRLLYRHLLIPGTRKAILEQSQQGQWMLSRPLWGHGRIDPFNAVKFGMLGLDQDSTVGNSDMMPLWELGKRQASDGSWNLHWDGLLTDPVDTSFAGALGDGATRKSLRVDEIRSMVEWLREFRPSRGRHSRENEHPDDQLIFPATVNQELASAGHTVFRNNCAECHSPSGMMTNQIVVVGAVESQSMIGTDSNRLEMWNPARRSNGSPQESQHPADRYNAFADDEDWDLNTFVETKGYASVPLNAIWLRSPYLHNGSVPTLQDLLNPPMSEDELDDMMQKLNPLVEVTGADPVDLKQLTTLLSRVPPSASPLSDASVRLHQLSSLVELALNYARNANRRPPLFYRGSDVIDSDRVGFICDKRAAQGRYLGMSDPFARLKPTVDSRQQPSPIPYVTFVRGNSNSGHLYGTELPSNEKKQLLEYLKTL